MAGTKNLFNADPLEVVIEALEKGNGISFDHNYVTIAITSVNATDITVSVEPNPIDTGCPYVEGISFNLNKLDLSRQIPKDVAYSGSWPASFEIFSSFMLANYGLRIKSGQWEISYDSTVVVLDDDAVIDKDLSVSRNILLRPTAAHPLFLNSMAIPIFVTSVENSFGVLGLNVVGGDGIKVVGDTADVRFTPVGGMAPYSFTIVSGTTPATLSEDSSSLTGVYEFSGDYSFVVQVTDSSGQYAQTQVNIAVQLSPFVILNGAPDGVLGQFYSHRYVGQGGVPPYSVHQINRLPVGLSIDSNGLLTGMPDTGIQDISVIFSDSVGNRFTLEDTIVVDGRDTSIVRTNLKDALTDWLELGAGHDVSYGVQSHPDGSSWSDSSLSVTNRRGPIAGAIDINYGFIVKLSEQIAMPKIAIALMAAKGFLSMGGCLFSAIDGDTGIDIRTSDQSDSQLLITVWVDGEPHALLTPENIEVLTDDFALITVQAADGILSVHRNTTLISWMFIPTVTTNLIGNTSYTIGRQSNYIEGYQWNGSLSQVLIFNQRLFQDQLAYLSNAGIGIQYWQLTNETDYWITPLSLIPTDQQTQIGQPFDQVVVQMGSRPIIHDPILCGGALPPGTFLDTSDLSNWRLVGTPTQAGVFTPYWVAQGDKEVKGVSVQIVVTNP